MSLKQKAKCFYLSISGVSKMREDVMDAFADAYQRGYSVVELARLTGSKSCKWIHSYLVKRGVIMGAKRGPLVRGLVPAGMGPYLSNRGLTFAKWCAGRGFDLRTVLSDIDNQKSGVLEAIGLDFPGLYKKMVGADPPTSVDIPDMEKLEVIRDQIVVSWDDDKSCYRCVIGESECVAFDQTPSAALNTAMWLHRGVKTIRRLRSLPDIRAERVGW